MFDNPIINVQESEAGIPPSGSIIQDQDKLMWSETEAQTASFKDQTLRCPGTPRVCLGLNNFSLSLSPAQNLIPGHLFETNFVFFFFFRRLCRCRRRCCSQPQLDLSWVLNVDLPEAPVVTIDVSMTT